MPLKVFYLDDEIDLCDIFFDSFNSPDVKVTTFTDPIKILEAFREGLPDLLFIDYRLPGTTGDRVALSLPKSVPKFLITGDLSVKTEYPFQAIFSKPYKTLEIQKIFDQFLKQGA